MLKEAHDKYGAKIQLNLSTEQVQTSKGLKTIYDEKYSCEKRI